MAKFHGRHSEDYDVELERALRARPKAGPEAGDQDRYYDGDTRALDDDTAPPWLDRSADREGEL